MSRLAMALAAVWLAGAGAGCSYFHGELPGGSCENTLDCIRGAEVCDTTTRTCVPVTDAAPRPDAPPEIDAGPDADIPDGGPDADLPDGGPDADIPDAGEPDV